MMTRIEMLHQIAEANRSPVDLISPAPQKRHSGRRALALLGNPFAIASMESVRTGHTTNGAFVRTLTGGTDNINGAITLSHSKSWTYGTTTDCINQAITTTVSITASGTNNFDLTGTATNVVGDTSAAVSSIKHIFIELINVAQDSTNGTACTSITIGNHATAAWVAPFGATGTVQIYSGGYFAYECPNAAGIAVTATTADLLKILNNDGSNAAYVRITILGLA